MANTVNGHTVIALSTDRSKLDIDLPRYRQLWADSALRGVVVLDTTGDFVIDDPTVATLYGENGTTGRIYVIAISYAQTTATTLTVKSKVGAAGAVTLDTWPLNTNGGILTPIRGDELVTATDQGGALLFNATNVSGGSPLTIVVTYAIAHSVTLG